MNPEADRLRRAMEYVDGIDSTEHQWLNDNADTVAELVDAAMDVSWHETGDNPDAYPLNDENVVPGPKGTTRNKAADALRRLARAVVDFKGPQEPPKPNLDAVEVIRCPALDCSWWRTTLKRDRAYSAYRAHYRQTHQGGKP